MKGILYNAWKRERKDIKSFGKEIIWITKKFLPNDIIFHSMMKAVIVCEGGLLTHAMILAREFGIPVFRVSEKDFDEILNYHGKEAKIEGNTLKIGDKSWKLERFS